MADSDIRGPNTRTAALEALRQAFQARIAQVWTNVTMAGERDVEERFEKGFNKAVTAYEKAWAAVDKHMKDK